MSFEVVKVSAGGMHAQGTKPWANRVKYVGERKEDFRHGKAPISGPMEKAGR